MATALFLDDAVAQEVYVPAGPPPGELQCPPLKHHHKNKHKQRKHNTEAMEPPDIEDLDGLHMQGEIQPQEVAMNERGKADATRPLAIALWGDSHTASNYFSEEIVRALGFAPDKVLPTFIPPDMDRLGVRLPIRKHCQGDGWSFEYAYASRQTGGAYTKGLVNLKSHVSGSYLWVDFRAHSQAPNLSSLDILFAPPGAGDKPLVAIRVDDGAEQFVSLEQGGEGVIHLRSDQPMATIKLRLVAGTLMLQGFVPHYVEKPAVFMDTFSIPGSTVRGWKWLDTDYLKARDNGVAYDLVMFEYGTNEGNDRGLDLNKYAADLRASLQNMRQVYPGALCVLIGPPDRGVLVKRKRGKRYRNVKPAKTDLLKYSLIHRKISDIQHAVGEEYSCAFWNWQDAMGGPGSSYQWLHHSPALMGRDITHMTVTGLQLSARRFAEDAKLTKYLHIGE
ncbi:MAG TPA: hypothetical protein VIU46_08270 [Gallionellaceae bacterium]